MEQKTYKASAMDVLRLFLWHIKCYKWTWFTVYFGIFIGVAFELAYPWVDKYIIDTVASLVAVGSRDISSLWQVVIVYALVRLGLQFGWRLCGLIVPRVHVRTEADITEAGLEKIFKQSYQFFTDEFSGSLIRRVQNLSESFMKVNESIMWTLFPATITIVGSFILFSTSYPKIALFLGAWFVLFILENIIFLKWKVPYDYARAEKGAEQTAALSDTITNGLNVLLFNRHRHEQERFARVTDEAVQAGVKAWLLTEYNWLAQGLIMTILEAGFLTITILEWQKGLITIGDFALIQGFAYTLIFRLWDSGRALRSVFEAIATGRESLDTLHQEVSVKDAPEAISLVPKRAAIDFKDVFFGYKIDTPILQALTFSIRGGEKVAFVGPSGAGKSTIIKLLLRAYDTTNGNIMIDGQSIKAVTQASLRDAISFVPQEPILFHRSLMENIRYGRMNAADKEVMEAAKKAHCHDFISALSEGYETHVGERGVKLSGGERQRVAIARAILKNAPILILDEATSSLDSESEALIQDALKELMKDKTVLVIAHRLSTVMQMDRLLVVEGGKVIDQGSHTELLTKDGLYQKLWNIQAGGFTA